MAHLLTFVLCVALSAAVSAKRLAGGSASSSTHLKFEVVNNCKEKIWPGLLGNPLVEESGFELAPGKSKTIQIPKGWQSGRVWARTGCDSSFQCETGSCGPNLKCEDNSGEAPFSYAEFNLAYSAGEEDYYNVNYADGYNVPITIEPVKGTFKKREPNELLDCGKAGACSKDLKDIAPEELKVEKNGKVVAVQSACAKFGTDEYCCTGDHNLPETCDPKKHWPNDYFSAKKQACPTANLYVYDDQTSTFSCIGSGRGRASPDYKITFC